MPAAKRILNSDNYYRAIANPKAGVIIAPSRGWPRTVSSPPTGWNNTGGCRSWHMDAHGVNRTLWSGMTWQYWLATRRFRPSECEFTS